ncbi:hypothetical protein D3C80_2116730 [compost metagenome]
MDVRIMSMMMSSAMTVTMVMNTMSDILLCSFVFLIGVSRKSLEFKDMKRSGFRAQFKKNFEK